jgi:protein arginine kinase activator
MKQCDVCGKNAATMKVSQVGKDGKAVELAVCSDCAREKGFTDVKKLTVNAAEIIADLRQSVDEADAKLVCPGCGLSYAEFKRQGRLGCGKCYEAFRDQLIPLVRRIHGAVQHVGRTATGGRKQAQVKMTVQKLRDALASAIQDEDYEKAAVVRDQLRRTEDEAGTSEVGSEKAEDEAGG